MVEVWNLPLRFKGSPTSIMWVRVASKQPDFSSIFFCRHFIYLSTASTFVDKSLAPFQNSIHWVHIYISIVAYICRQIDKSDMGDLDLHLTEYLINYLFIFWDYNLIHNLSRPKELIKDMREAELCRTV